ncbi:collagen alpha-1(XII) chain [Elysia marginata]|uniref:Collagen alpha-1(XII) chain n=1 Tax=Elysia marginata TaxID=1093978 RepID=A0AAV4HUN9_9GAST|nr:collagen alpha-1(XII) chain [Elysia marginata]
MPCLSLIPAKGFGLNNFTTEAEVVEAIENINRAVVWDTNSYNDLVDLRMKQMTTEIFRPNVPHIAVVLTDGKAQRDEWTKNQGQKASQAGITVICVGVGQSINHQELLSIASGNSDNVFNITNLEVVDNIVAEVGNRICEAVDPAE